MNSLIRLERMSDSLPAPEAFLLGPGQLLVIQASSGDVRVNGLPLKSGRTAVASGAQLVRVQGSSLQLALLKEVPEPAFGLDIEDESFRARTSIFFQSLKNACEMTDVPDSYMISAAVLQFLSHWHRRRTGGNELALRTARWLEEHCRQNVTAQDAADALGYSRWHVMHSFSRAFNMPVHEYLMRCRMAHIKKDITDGTWTMEQVAQNNGFSSRSAMHKAFRRIYGITPGQYRRYTERNEEEMKKNLVAAGALSLSVLAGCASPSAPAQDKAEGDEKTVHILAKDQDGKTVFDEDVTTDAQTLTDVLKNSDALEAKLEDGQYGTMVMGLAGLETEDWNKGPWWTYESENNEVCQEQSYCPAADDVLVKDGDNFVFTFSSGS